MKKGKKEKPGKGKAENSTAEKLTRKAYETELARLHAERPHLLIVPSHCTASIAEARGYVGG